MNKNEKKEHTNFSEQSLEFITQKLQETLTYSTDILTLDLGLTKKDMDILYLNAQDIYDKSTEKFSEPEKIKSFLMLYSYSTYFSHAAYILSEIKKRGPYEIKRINDDLIDKYFNKLFFLQKNETTK